VSRRYLEYAFNDAFGTSPSRYLRLLRLHEVRRRLRKPDAPTTVTREALRLGFNHLSLFSLQYKKAFGESPSATLSARTPGSGRCLVVRRAVSRMEVRPECALCGTRCADSR
jgi:AraC family ethanolamine operon transcriptional activator